jgi:hypothetical protein
MTINQMADQLLWIETLLKGGIGLIMLLAPIMSARLVGLPHGNSAFWPRMFGAALVGIAGAFAVEGYSQMNAHVNYRGLGLAGAVVINLVTLLSLFGTLIFKGITSRRGHLLVVVFCFLLPMLMLFEIANL